MFKGPSDFKLLSVRSLPLKKSAFTFDGNNLAFKIAIAVTLFFVIFFYGYPGLKYAAQHPGFEK